MTTYTVNVTNLLTGETITVRKRTTDAARARQLATRAARKYAVGWNGPLRLQVQP